MSHDATKCLMGVATDSDADIQQFNADPASFAAGTAVRLKSDSTISVVKADGAWIGVSMGRSLSNHKKLSVLASGRGVPMLVARQPARGSIVITSVANLLATTADSITVGATEFTAQAGATTPGQATFRAATSTAATATDLAAQINAHATAGALVIATIDPANSSKVILTAKLNTTAADTIALVYTDKGTATVGATVSGATLDDSDDSPDWLVLGAKAYISDDTGLVDDPNSAATISDAIIASALLSGIDEDGNAVNAVLVNMPGGL